MRAHSYFSLHVGPQRTRLRHPCFVFPPKFLLGLTIVQRNPYAHFGGKKGIVVFLNKAYTCVPYACVVTLNNLMCVCAPQYLNLMVLGIPLVGGS